MSAELAALVNNGELDAAIATRPVKPFPAGLVALPLYSDRFWLIAPSGAKGRDLADMIREYPFIRFDPRAWAGRMIEMELRKHGLQIREEMVLDSQEAIVQMVSKGLGVAIVPIADDEVASLKECIGIPFGDPPLSRDVVLLAREDRVEHRAVEALAHALVATYEEKLKK
jgi:DNA-binding transcriptional LysR family regulator